MVWIMEQMKEGKEHSASVALLESIGDAFNRHDLDGVMRFFAEDGVFDKPAGQEILGQRIVGKEAIRKEFATLFETLPDLHWEPIANWVSGNKGCSEWHRTGTTRAGIRQDWLGLDLFTFRDGKIIRKDTYFKIVG